jgi:UDP-N-acetylglucosamine:LPS N-acetylglucosamine transferase
MYHSIIIQFLGSMGIVGLVMFLVHIKHVAEIMIRSFSGEKLLLLLVPFGVIVASMVDNFFFYSNCQIFYAVFLALAEHSLEKSREERLLNHKKTDSGRRPRVVFTYVEAGKGHIVPEKAVCDSFKKKYSDDFEIVESYFYTDGNDEKLEKTEKLFAAAVKRQNKSRVLSWLCRTGNWICGDRFALYFLMTFTFSGMQSRRRAKKALVALDADVIFTTHWSTAFYASLLKDPPYTVMLCPDAYSNGMFNVDVNDLLIPSESGKKDAEKIRMYGGGNITAIDFPIRNEALAFYGKKKELRAELGLSNDDFVVTMSDGGYGLANMEATIYKLLETDARLTVFALCGTNERLFERLSEIKETGSIKLIPISFTNDVLKYIAAADLFCGKSGANSMAEPAFFGVPIIVTRSITYIERKIKKYYVKELGGALSIPFPKRAARKIAYFAENPEALVPYHQGLEKVCGKAGTDAVADILYDRVITKVYK